MNNKINILVDSALIALLWGITGSFAFATCTPVTPNTGQTVACTGTPTLPLFINSFSSSVNNLTVNITSGSIFNAALLGGSAISLTGNNATLNNAGTIDPSTLGLVSVLTTGATIGNSNANTITVNNAADATIMGTSGLLGLSLTSFNGMALNIINGTGGISNITNSGAIGSKALLGLTLLGSDAPVIVAQGGGKVNFTNNATGVINGRIAFQKVTNAAITGGHRFTNAGTINGSVSLGAGSINTFVAVTGSVVNLAGGAALEILGPSGLISFAQTGKVDGGLGGDNTLVLQNVTDVAGGSGVTGTGAIDGSKYINFNRLIVNSGTWTLTGAITNGTGSAAKATTLNGGVVKLNNGVVLGSTLTANGGAIEALANLNLSFSGVTLLANGLTIQGVNQLILGNTISGVGGIIKNGTGSLVLNGNNNYAGGTTLNAGSLIVGHNNALGTGTLTVAGGTTLDNNTAVSLANALALINNSNLTIGGSAALTLNGVISGNGGLIKNGLATLTLGGNNSFTGNLNIHAGQVIAGSGGLGNAAGVNIDTGAKLNLNGNAAIGALTGGGIVELQTAKMTVGSGNVNSTFAGVIQGATGSLEKVGTGTLILTGSNTYGQGTTVSAGTVQVGDGGTIGSIQGNVLNNGTLISNRSDNLIYGDIISGVGSLVKQGAGILTLTGANSYTGNTTISAGTLQIGNGGITGSIVGNVVNNSTLAFNRGDALTYSGTISGSGSVTQKGAGVVTLTGANTYTGGALIQTGALNLATATAAGSGSINISGGQLQLGFNGGTLANNLIGSGATQVLGSNITLSGNNSGYTGAWNIATGASANINTSNNLGQGTVNLVGGLNITGGAFTFNNVLTGNGALNVALTNSNNPFAFGAGVGSGFTGTLHLGQSSFGLTGNNTAALTNATLQLDTNSMTTVGAGVQQIGNLILNGGKLIYNALGTDLITAAQVTLTSGDIAIDPTALTGSGGSLLMQDDGINKQLIHVTGGLTGGIAGLRLVDGSGAMISDSISDIIQNSTVVAKGSYSYGLNVDSNGLNVNYRLSQLDLQNGKTLVLAGDSATPAGANTQLARIIGSGNLEINAANSIILNNSTNSYTGSTTVSGGTLLLGSDNALGQTSNLIINSGTTANINGKTQTIGALNGSGILDINSGNLSVVSGGTFAGIIAGTGAFNLGSGTLTLTGDNTYTGSTSLAGGKLTIGDGGTTGSYAGNIGLTNSGSVVFNRSNDLTYATIISGEGSLVKQGAGILTLTGANSYTGNTTISAGTLQIGNGGITGSIVGNVVNNSTLAFNRGDALTYSGTISGSGSITQMGADTVTLTGANTYTGGTLIQTGALNLATATAAGSGDIDISGGQLQLGFNGDTLANNLIGSGATQVLGSNITLSGNNSSYTGAWNIATGASANINTSNNLGQGTVNLVGGLNITGGAFTFNNVLTGNGALNVALTNSNNPFAFGAGVGSGFTGTLHLGQSSFGLTGNNTAALTNATLQLDTNSMTTVGSGAQHIDSLTLNGGTLIFDGTIPAGPATGTIVTNNLVLTSGTVQIDAPILTGIENPVPAPGANLLAQDDGPVLIQLITSGGVSGSANQLNLTDHMGNVLANNVIGVKEAGVEVATAHYGFGLTTSESNNGLYVTYGLTMLELLANKTLNLTA